MGPSPTTSGAGKVPLAGAGASVFSFVHVADVATAVVAALDYDVPGVLNVVDDDPTPIRDWLPEMAEVLGAPHPDGCRFRWSGSLRARGEPPTSADYAEPTTHAPGTY